MQIINRYLWEKWKESCFNITQKVILLRLKFRYWLGKYCLFNNTEESQKHAECRPRLHTPWFHFMWNSRIGKYYSVVTESMLVLLDGRAGETDYKGAPRNFRVMEVFCTLIAWRLHDGITFIKAHHTLHLKRGPLFFFVCKLFLNQADFSKLLSKQLSTEGDALSEIYIRWLIVVLLGITT